MAPCPLSVVVPVRNGAAFLAEVVGALRASPGIHEIIVVDDGSTDDSAAVARAAGADVVIASGGVGPAAARNLGASRASGRILMFVDADVVVHADAVTIVRRTFDADPTLAGLFGSYDDAPSAPNFVSQYKNLQHHFVHQTSNSQTASFWAGCGAIRRDVFVAAGGFDEARYPRPSIEDIELGLRLRRLGERVQLVKTLQATHLKRWTLRQLIHVDIGARARPWSQLAIERAALPADLNLQWPHRLSAVAVWSVLLLLLAAFWAGAGARAWLIGAATAAGGMLVILNAGFYSFLTRRRGLVFAIRAMPLQWLYYLYGSAVFAATWIESVTLSLAIDGRR